MEISPERVQSLLRQKTNLKQLWSGSSLRMVTTKLFHSISPATLDWQFNPFYQTFLYCAETKENTNLWSGSDVPVLESNRVRQTQLKDEAPEGGQSSTRYDHRLNAKQDHILYSKKRCENEWFYSLKRSQGSSQICTKVTLLLYQRFSGSVQYECESSSFHLWRM